MKTLATLTQVAIVSVTLCALETGSAFASLITVDLGKNLQEIQTDAAGDMAGTNDYFAARAFYRNTGDYDSAALTWPGAGSPVSMTNVPGTYMFLNGGTAAGYFLAQSSSFGSQAALDAAYPMGSYEYDLSDSTLANPPISSTVEYTADLYPANQPTLTAASFNALQGLDTTQAVTVSFGALQDNLDFDTALGDEDFVFLDVYTAGFGTDVFSTFSTSPAGLTSFVIPASTLTPGASYSLLLDFDNRFAGTDGNGINQYLLFDTKTEVDFVTAASVATPEPSGLAFAGLGCFALGWVRYRRRDFAPPLSADK